MADAKPGPDPLASEPWLAFNARHWGVRYERVAYSQEGKRLPELRGALYLDGRGRVLQPPVNPHVPLELECSHGGVEHPDRDWLTLAPLLADDLLRRSTHTRIILPAQFTDARPFQWAGLRCGLYYTYVLPFPYDVARAGSDIRRRIAKARSLGYRCTVHAPAKDALACIAESEARQGFGYRIGLPALERLVAELGPEVVRIYATYAPDGQPASAFVSLMQPGSTAYAFLTGSASNVLPTGATQLTIATMLEDLQAAGAARFDYVGANTRSIAAAKAQWGCELVSHLTVEQVNARSLLRDMRNLGRAALHKLRRPPAAVSAAPAAGAKPEGTP